MSPHQDHLPTELQATADAMDRLARAEAQSAPADLVGRLVTATRPARSQPERQHRHLRIWTRRPVMALAASVALVATASLTWLAVTQTPSESPDVLADYANDFDLLLTLTADDAWSAEVDLLKADTAAIEASLDSSWDFEGSL